MKNKSKRTFLQVMPFMVTVFMALQFLTGREDLKEENMPIITKQGAVYSIRNIKD